MSNHKYRPLNYKPDLAFPYQVENKRQLGAVYRWNQNEVASADANPVFTATLKLDYIYHGRSSLKMHFKDTTSGQKYEMFFSDFEDVMHYHTLKPGVEFTDKFHVEQKGGYYGLVAHCGRKVEGDKNVED